MNRSELIAVLRFGDSAFPSGGFAFSSGLEGAVRDGFVTREHDVLAFAAEAVVNRWHTMDRVLLRAAWTDPVHADRLAEASNIMSTLREASRRSGAALLSTFASLGSADAVAYRADVLSGRNPGHLPVAQAVCYRGQGLDLDSVDAMSGWQVLSGIASAALRLGVIGHLGSQRVMDGTGPVLASTLELVPDIEPSSFTAFADIAAQRRGDGIRLFAS
ncbi:urease accessory protein UreF [Rhodococcoides yunnanense]|uniref:urease accessory protein UreF n=1 Tax=Rhodococcoides yunnanense TaxID=278209 RepID=UPI0009327655|nr:urease accessory UreF family protein [Rhodococcus yunnanensis]